MKRAIFALLAVTLVASSTGCCCLDRLFCWGCQGGCGGCGGCGGSCGYYGNEGPGCSSCGGGGCSDCGGGGYGANDGSMSNAQPTRAMASRSAQQRPTNSQRYATAKRRPAQAHPMVHQRRDADDEYEFAAGPPTGATTYPYYTNRGPRDFLAKNPRSIGP